MLFIPNSQPVLIEENQRINTKNTSEEEMTSSFSNLHGVFCLTYFQAGQRCSLWSKGLSKLIRLYFNFKEVKDKELIYFPPEGKEIVVFGRRV